MQYLNSETGPRIAFVVFAMIAGFLAVLAILSLIQDGIGGSLDNLPADQIKDAVGEAGS